jgi:hypothetical protein
MAITPNGIGAAAGIGHGVDTNGNLTAGEPELAPDDDAIPHDLGRSIP